MKKFVSILLSAIMILTSTSTYILSVYAENDTNHNISLNEKFSASRVIVVLNNEASLEFKEYSSSDFKQYGCSSISNLSTATATKIRQTLNNIKDHVLNGTPLLNYDGIEIGDYNQVICLNLQKSDKANVISVINKLNKRDDVLYASPDYELDLCTTEANDGLYDLQTYYELIELEEAWDITKGSDNVTVGIIDTGIDGNHPDFDDNIDVSLSMNFTSGFPVQCIPTDNETHGTACAGVVGAQGNNNKGISGVCWNIKLASFNVSEIVNDELVIYSSRVSAAINYAESIDIPILNISLGWSPYDETGAQYNHPLNTSISNYSGLAVCAAGNEERNIDVNETYPGSYSLSNIITVAASDENDQVLSSSNYGSTSVDIFAPGIALTTVDTDWALNHDTTNCLDLHIEYFYHYLSGTSMAAPMVAGVAALMLSVNPNLTPQELKHIIMENGDYVSDFSNLCVSGKRLNAYNAVNHARNHTLNVSGTNATTHSLYCNSCGYVKTENHKLYMYFESSNAYQLKCSTVGCSYLKTCTHTPTYTFINTTEHEVSCPYGCYPSFYESHGICTYEETISFYYHNATCQDCDETYLQPHSWIRKNSLYICTLCGKTSNQAPSIIQNIPPSNEEDDLTE